MIVAFAGFLHHAAAFTVVDITSREVRMSTSTAHSVNIGIAPSPSVTQLQASPNTDRITVVLTREEGKNDKLRTQITQNHPDMSSKLDLVELPCIAHASGPDYDKLSDTLKTQQWDYIVVTSPEAAKVLASAWIMPTTNDDNDDTTTTQPLIAAVGKATEKALEDAGITVSFCPSKATAETLAVELEPRNDKDDDTTTTSVLYPASARAQKTLEVGLTQRGCFTVTRLNTYDTVTATWDETQKSIGTTRARIACFASPSSIKGWLQNTNNHCDVFAACIGETSAKACLELGWDEDRIFYPEKPGLDGWISAIEQAVQMIDVTETKDHHHHDEELQRQ